MTVRDALDSDLEALADLAKGLQARPDRHVAYLPTEASAIAAELTGLGSWTSVSAVIDGPSGPVGWLVGEVDQEMGRVWWWGPMVAGQPWEEPATQLLEHARARLPDGVDEEEFAVDERFVDLCRWAEATGYDIDPGSAILTRSLDGPVAEPEVPVRAAAASDSTVLGPLHDQLFPGTHTTGARLFEPAGERLVRLVVELDGQPVGYVAIEHTSDDEAYIDYLGVDPTKRRRGLGAALVSAALVEGRRLGAHQAALTVRRANDGARALYRSLGFTEERILVPVRRGFRLP